jgi:plasmid stabilization system protein ParE
MTPSFSPEAEAELFAERDHYEAEREGLGLEFVDEVEAMVKRIGEAPMLFQRVPRSRRHRRAVLPRFPFNIVFEVVGDQVRIIAVAPQSRRPHYWRGRT